MRTFLWHLTSSHAVALLSMGLCQRSAGAQPSERASLPLIKAPVVQDVAPLGAKGLSAPNAVGVGPTEIREVAPVIVDASAYKVAAAVKKLRAREMTPQQAWDSDALDVDALVYFLEKGLDSWGGFFYEKDPDLRRALVALLVEHGNEKLKKPEELAPTVRLWLADYYGSIDDERVLPLSESILKEMKPVKGENALAFQALERIAWFHRSKGQSQKAAQTWLRMKMYHSEDGWWQPDALLEAARLYNQAGNQAKARELYDEILKSGDGWGTGMALWDQASGLVMQNKHEEARKLLSIPVVGPRANDIRVVLSAELAYSYYLTQETIAARRSAQKSLEQFDKVSNPSAGIREFAERAHNILSWLKVWEEEPIICRPRKMQMQMQRGKSERGDLSIWTLGDVPLTITANTPELQIQVGKGGNQSEFYFERSIIVRTASNVSANKMDAILTIRSPKFPTFILHLPIHFDKLEGN